MKKIVFLFTILFLSAIKLSNAQSSNIVQGNLLVMLHSENDVQSFLKEFQFLNGVKTDLRMNRVLSQSMHIYLIDFNSSAVNQDQLLDVVKTNSLVKIAQFNHTFRERISIPNDSLFGSMWDMNNTGQSGGAPNADIDAPEAWDITTGGLTAQGDTIVVAVIDGGFDLTQKDLNFWKNFQEIPNNGNDDDGNGFIDDYNGWNGATATDNWSVASHGTHVSGTVGAKGNNGIGVTGVNWNVKVMPIAYGSGGSFESNVIASYAYVMDQRRLYNQTNGGKGAFIVATNSSFGIDLAMPSAHPLWCAMYDSLGAVGVLSAGATANANYNVDVQGDIPTACTSNWLITVTNTTRTDTKNSSCGYGTTTIDLGAPGTNITSTYPSDTYSSITGTSMATPHVAGAVALMYSVPCLKFITAYKSDPAGVALMVKDSLLNAVDIIPALSGGLTVTGGRLNLFKSVNSIQNYCNTSYVSVEEYSDDQLFEIKKIYPNPATGILNIVYNSSEAVEFTVVNVLGQEVKHVQGDSAAKGIQHSQIDLNTIGKGIYFVRIISKNKKSITQKIFVY